MRTTRKQMEEYGGWMDRHETISAQAIIDLYDAVAAAPTFDVSRSNEVVQWAYDCYRQSVSTFLDGVGDLNRGAHLFLDSGRETDRIPFQQWGVARQTINNALAMLIPAIDRLEEEGY